jgi:hypothetical protein
MYASEDWMIILLFYYILQLSKSSNYKLFKRHMRILSTNIIYM